MNSLAVSAGACEDFSLTAPSSITSGANRTSPACTIQQRPPRFSRPVAGSASIDDDSIQPSIERCRIPLPGYALGEVGYDYEEPPPPSYPNSSSAAPIPDSARRSRLMQSSFIERDSVNPPPNYTDCAIPPPTYDDLYESADISPKATNIRVIMQDMKRFILYLCAVCLGMVLLAIGVKHMVLTTCKPSQFLEIWCISTSGIIFICVSIATFQSLRDLLKRIETFAPILIYSGTIFCMSWFIGGLIYSWDQLRDGRCDTEVPRTAFAACVIIFVFLIIFCCCGKKVFHQNRTLPDR